MKWLTNIFSESASGIVDSVGNAIDKLQLKNELIKIKLEAEHKAEQQALDLDKQITERWKSDNEHSITRLVRPVAYAWVIVLFTAVMIADGNIGEFQINEAYIPVIQAILMTMTIAYFGSRGIEKITKTIKEK